MGDDKTVGEYLADLGSSTSPSVRAVAAFMLTGEELDTSQKASVRRSLTDEDGAVRDQVGALLAQLRDIESFPVLVRLLDQTPPSQCRSIAWGIAELVPVLSVQDRKLAVAALERYHSRARGSSREHGRVLLRRANESTR